MIDYDRTHRVLHLLNYVFNPTVIGLNPDKKEQWEEIRGNWEFYYKEENRETLAKFIIEDIKQYVKFLPEKKYFGNYQDDLLVFKQNFMRVLEEYKFNSFCKARFLNYNRKLLMTQTMFDQNLGAIIRYISPVKSKISKENMKLVLDTYLFCFDYIVENLNKREPNIKQLELLELPTNSEKLRELVLSCENLGELFLWKATGFTFDYWATDFFKNSVKFKNKVHKYLNELHPELDLPIEKAKEKVGYYALELEAVNLKGLEF